MDGDCSVQTTILEYKKLNIDQQYVTNIDLHMITSTVLKFSTLMLSLVF